MFKIVNFLFFSSSALKIMGRNWNWNWSYKGRNICQHNILHFFEENHFIFIF